MKKIKWDLRLLAVMLLLGPLALTISSAMAAEKKPVQAQQPPAEEVQSTQAESAAADTGPDLADIVPAAAELTSRLKTLENMITSGPDVVSIENKCAALKADLDDLTSRLKRLKASSETRYKDLLELKSVVEQKISNFKAVTKPLNTAIRQLDVQRKQWLIDQETWKQSQASLLQAEQLNQLNTTFEDANATITKALGQTLSQLEGLLALQAKTAPLQTDLNGCITELDLLIDSKQRSMFYDTSVPMFSKRFISQFSPDMWISLLSGIEDISWPNLLFLSEYGWVILIQIFFTLLVTVTVFRNRQALEKSDAWRFLVYRPFSAGLFFFCVVAMFFYEYLDFSFVWKQLNIIVAGISFLRLSGVLITVSRRKQFAYGLTIIFIVTQFLDGLNFPVPLFRLYTVAVLSVGLFYCRQWIRQGLQEKEPTLYMALLRLVFLFMSVVIIIEFWGKTSLAFFLFQSLIRSIAIVMAFKLFVYMIRGFVEWLFHTSVLQRASALYSDTNNIIRRVTKLIVINLWGLLLVPGILTVWGIYDSLQEATKGLLELGITWGGLKISVGSVLVAVAIIYGSFIVSWIVQKVSMDVMLRTRKIERGAQYSMKRLIHYVIVVIGFLVALGTLGFEATKITILLSALGVGIGFGLQGVVNNFVSGLILLFERPVRVGDTIQIGGNWAEICRIGLRSTTVKTWEEADVIIPNSDLISNQVTNWTLSNRQVRLTIAVGVAYGSDVPLVMETLAACVKENERVSSYPAAQVLFRRFGESSLDFELRVWVKDADHRLSVMSELHQYIDRVFREKQIEIAFPQRDLHLRTVDDLAIVRTSQANREGNKKKQNKHDDSSESES